MSATIDERVVEMRFDSKQFKEEAKSTLGVLDRLKEALKFTDSGKGLDKLNKSVKDVRLDGIAAGMEMLTKRFSTFGIVGMQIIQNVTNALTNKLVGAIRYAEDAIVSGGIRRAMNIENAHFQLQALLKDEEKVQAVMDNAMESVDGTAYAYDEAAKAAAMFAASGIQAGDEMLNSLKAITGVAAMTNSQFEDISAIFTTVAGNGRLMGDELLQLSSRGLNAASTITDYLREVQHQSDITEQEVRDMVSKGEISFQIFSDAMNWAFGESAKRANETFTGAMSNMKSALARIGAGFVSPLVEQNGVLVDAFNTLRVKINEVKSELVFDEETSAVKGFTKTLGMSAEGAQNFYNKVREAGKVTIDNITNIKAHGQNGYKELKRYFNGINDGSVRASYSITQTVKALTDGNEVTKKDIRRFVKQGKIDFDIFSAAYERAFGADHQKLSKQFTDTVTKVVDTIRGEVEKFDVTKITNTVYKAFNSLKNVLYGLYTVLKPVGLAFADVFLGFNYNDISHLATNIENLTAKFRLSDEGADKLRRTFRGVFDILALVGDGLIALIRSFTPFGATIKEGSGSLLDLTANLGDALTEFSKWVRTSPKVQAGFETFSKSIATVAKAISVAGNGISDFVTMVWEMEATQRVISKVGDIFTKFGDIIRKVSKSIVDSVSEFIDKLGEIEFTSIKKVLEGISEAFMALGRTLMKNEGVRAFVEHFKEFLSEIENALSKDTIMAKLEALKKAFGSFFDFLKGFASFITRTISPLFEHLTLGGVASAGLGTGIVVAIFKLSKALESISESIGTVPDMLGTLKDTLEGYQENLKADSIRKIAGAIAILAGSLVLLSFADTDRLLGAAMALSTISGVLLGGVTALMIAVKKGETAADALTTFSDHMGRAFRQIAKGIKWKLVGSALKDFGIAVALIAGSVAGLAVLYKIDPKSTTKAFDMIKIIAAGMAGVMVSMSVLGQFFGKGMKSFQQAAVGVVALSASMFLIISAMKKLMKMKLPEDYKSRMAILAGILAELAVLTVAVGAASRISGGNVLSAASIIALCAMLVVSVNALKKLFDMELPSDYKTKLGIFTAVFVEVAALAVAVGLAGRISGGGKIAFAPILAMAVFLYSAVGSLKKLMSVKLPSDWGLRFAALEIMFVTLGTVMVAVAAAGRLSGGAIKATGTILSMCIFLATATAALMVLSIIPTGGLIKGAVALGVVLLSLATTLKSVAGITDENAYKVVLAMAVTIGAITASLGVLSMISWGNLAKSGLALGTTLLALAANFKAVSKITNDKVWIDILAMVGAMVAIVTALAVLTMFDMEQLIVSATALSTVLLGFSGAMLIISKAKKIKKEQMMSFLAASLILVPITAALAVLAHQPWEGLLAASVTISVVMLAFAETMKMMSSRTGIKMEKMQAFLLASLVLVPITAALAVLAHQPWEGLLTAAITLSATMLAYAEAMKILSSARGINLAQMGVFLAGSLALVPIVAALAMLAKYDWQGLLAAGASISAVMLSLSVGLGVVSKVGASVPSALKGIAMLDLFIADLVLVLAALGKINEIPGIQQLLSGGGDILGKIGEALGKLVSGIGVGLASGLPQIGQSLSQFAMNITPFVTTMQMFASSNAVQGCMQVVKMVLALTAASFIQGVSNFLSIFTGGSSLSKLGEELNSFGPYIKKFSEDVSGINVGAVTAASAAGQMIAKLYEALPKTGGWMQVFTGESMTLTQFASELTAFGPNIAVFADQVKDVKPEAVKGAASAAKIIASIYDELPKQGGWMQAIMGEDMSLAQFALELTLFGPSIATFADQVKDVKPEAVKGAASAAKIMAKLYDELPELGGLKAKIFGETMSLSSFGTELTAFAPDLVDFADDVKDLDEDSVKGAASVAKVMSTLAKELPDTKNLAEKLFGGGTMSLSEFGAEIVKFAPNIVDFADAVDEIEEDSVSGAMDAVKLIVDTMDLITKSESKTSLSTFGTELEKFGKSLVVFYNQMVKTDFSEISTITANIKKLVEVAKDAGEQGASAFVKAINSQNGSVTRAVNTMVTKAITKLNLAKPKFKMSGQQAGQKFIEGITNKLANNITAMKQNAMNLGKYYVQGFARGITNNLDIASRAAASMAKKADEAVAKELDEHSPSKLAEKRGAWYVGGMIIGLLKGRKKIEAASETVAKLIDKGIMRHRGKIQENMDDISKIIEKFAKKSQESLYKYIGYGFDVYSKIVQDRLNKMTDAIATSYKKIDKMQASYDAKVKRQEKIQQETENKQQAFEEETQKQLELMQRQEELAKMKPKERAKELKKEAKERRQQAKAEAIAYAKIYGDQKKAQKDFLNTNTEYYKKLLKIKNTGNNKALYADKSFEEAEIDILKRLTETLESYKEKLESTRDSIMGQMNFFEAVDKEKEVKSKEDLIKNAKDQLDLYQEYISIQGSLKSKIGGTELYKYLETLGVDSTDQLRVINEMTSSELSEYVSLYDQKFQLATVAAQRQLEGFQTEIEAQIEDILSGVVKDVNLYSFVEQFDGKLSSILGEKKTKKKFKDTITDFYKNNVKDISKTFGIGVAGLLAAGVKEKELENVIDQMPGATKKLQLWTTNVVKDTEKTTKPQTEKSAKNVAGAAKLGLQTMSKDFYDIGQKSGKNLAAGMKSQVAVVKEIAKQLESAAMVTIRTRKVEEIENAVSDSGRNAAHAAEKAGQAVSSGFASGISKGRISVGSAAAEIGAAAIGSFKDKMGIHSPSKVMDEFGELSVLGFVNGMMRLLARVSASSEQVADASKDGMDKGLSRITQLFDDDLIDPVITPIVDMSNIRGSIDEINRMFNDSVRYISTGASMTSMAMNDRFAEQTNGRTNGVVKNYFNFEQNNTSPKSLSTIDIYRNTKNQFTQFRERVEGV